MKKSDRILLLWGIITGIIFSYIIVVIGIIAYKKNNDNNINKKEIKERPANLISHQLLNLNNTLTLRAIKTEDNAKLSFSERYSQTGLYSLKVIFPKSKGKPGFYFQRFEKDILDWSDERVFAFDVANPTKNAINLSVEIKSGKDYKVKTFYRALYIPAQGLYRVIIPTSLIAEKIDIDAVSYFRFFIIAPSKEICLYFSNFISYKTKDNRTDIMDIKPAVYKISGLKSISTTLSKKPKPQVVIDVYPLKEIQKINKYIYGSNLAAKTEFEMDVAKFGKDIGISLFRFPGGGAEGYRWKSGTFDFSNRFDKAPLSKIDNVIKFCNIVGAKLLIQINIESATAKEAAEWVDYMNHKKGFYVKYWEIGNEPYGDWEKDYMSAAEYAALLRQYSFEMKKVDPSIKIGGCIGGPNYESFDKEVIQKAGDYIDFVSYHWYPNHVNKHHPYKGSIHPSAEDIMANSLAVGKIIQRVNDMVKRYAPQREGEIKVAFLEWDGSWDAVSSDLDYKYKGMSWSLANAIFYADTLGQFAVHGVEVACNFNFQEVMFGYIRGWDKDAGWGGSRWDGETIRPKALAMKLFARYFGDILITSKFRNPPPSYKKESDWRPDSYTGDVPYISVYASKFSNEKKLSIVLINKHPHDNFNIKINLHNIIPEKQGHVWILTGPDLKAQNDGTPGNVAISTFRAEGITKEFLYKSPPHSVTLMNINYK